MLAKRWLYFVLCLLIPLLMLPVLAQDFSLTRQVELPDGFIISIPQDWTVEETDEIGALIFAGDSARARAITPDALRAWTDFEKDTPLDDILVSLYRDFAAERARASEVETLTLGDFDAASYRFTKDNAEGLFIVIDFGGGSYGLFEFVAPAGELDGLLELAHTIAATFSESDVVIDPKTGLPVGTTPSEGNTVSGVSCTVSTSVEGTASVHVGPGYNRAIVTFLTPGDEFTVTGSFMTEDWGEWFQLDKREIPSAAAANEVWVPRELVDEQGDCDSVGAANEPPLIPNVNIPPLQSTAEPGVPVPATPVPVEGGLVPDDGTWTMTFAPTTPVSCLNTETVHIDSSELWNTEPFVSRMTVARDGSSFSYGANTFTRSAPGTYSGSFTFDDGSNAQVRFDVITPSQIVGQVVYNENVSGTPCSATGTLYVNRN